MGPRAAAVLGLVVGNHFCVFREAGTRGVMDVESANTVVCDWDCGGDQDGWVGHERNIDSI